MAITADNANMQAELDAKWGYLLPAFQANPLPEDDAGQQKLKDAVANLTAHPRNTAK